MRWHSPLWIDIIMKMFFLFLLVVSLFAENVIEVHKEIVNTLDRPAWETLRLGRTQIQNKKLYVALKDNLWVQELSHQSTLSKFKLKIHEESDFNAYGVCVSDSFAYVSGLNRNEFLFHVYKYDMMRKQILKTHRRVSIPGAMRWREGNSLLIAGGYRPSQLKHEASLIPLNRARRWQEMESSRVEYFKDITTYNMTVFDGNLNLIDTLSISSRRGTNVRLFEKLYHHGLVETDEKGNVYRISYQDHFSIEVYGRDNMLSKEIAVRDDWFVGTPQIIDEEWFERSINKPSSYSSVYCLVVSGDHLLVSYFQVPKSGDHISGPFPCTVIDLVNGGQTNRILTYPILNSEDDQVYICVELPGGWLSQSRTFLVQYSLKEIEQGLADSESPMEAVQAYLEKND